MTLGQAFPSDLQIIEVRISQHFPHAVVGSRTREKAGGACSWHAVNARLVDRALPTEQRTRSDIRTCLAGVHAPCSHGPRTFYLSTQLRAATQRSLLGGRGASSTGRERPQGQGARRSRREGAGTSATCQLCFTCSTDLSSIYQALRQAHACPALHTRTGDTSC